MCQKLMRGSIGKNSLVFDFAVNCWSTKGGVLIISDCQFYERIKYIICYFKKFPEQYSYHSYFKGVCKNRPYIKIVKFSTYTNVQIS